MRVDFKGKVTDEFGNPLVGANVVSITGTKRGVITGLDGFFQFNDQEGEFFEISHIGFKPTQFLVTSRTFATPVFILKEDVFELEGFTGTPTSPKAPILATNPIAPVFTGTSITAPILTTGRPTVQVASTTEKSFLDKILENPLIAGGLFLGGILLGGFLLGARKKKETKTEA